MVLLLYYELRTLPVEQGIDFYIINNKTIIRQFYQTLYFYFKALLTFKFVIWQKQFAFLSYYKSLYPTKKIHIIYLYPLYRKVLTVNRIIFLVVKYLGSLYIFWSFETGPVSICDRFKRGSQLYKQYSWVPWSRFPAVFYYSIQDLGEDRLSSLLLILGRQQTTEWKVHLFSSWLRSAWC